jgi:acetyl esterase/lipase
MTGLLMPSDGFDDECSEAAPGRVMAIVNYYGPTDLVNGLDQKVPFLLGWLKRAVDAKDLASRLSPLNYVREDSPPILTIHGDADEMVPYQDAVKLREALSKAGVANELVSIPCGKHGRFRWTDADTVRVQRTIESFLRRYGLTE